MVIITMHMVYSKNLILFNIENDLIHTKYLMLYCMIDIKTAAAQLPVFLRK